MADDARTDDPQNDDEWTIHALNIHGTFFERWCERVVAESAPWRLHSTQYPVEYPPPNGPLRGKESTLDIRAECRVRDNVLTLIIECKKNNPGFVDWVFFKKHPATPARFIGYAIDTVPMRPPAPAPAWQIQSSTFSGTTTLPVASEARETRGSYQAYRGHRDEKTKTANSAITQAATQVALATRAIVAEELEHTEALRQANASPLAPFRRQMVLPVIVTTANLRVCEFDPSQIDSRTGEIAYSDVRLEPVPALVYEYPLPRLFQSGPANLAAAIQEKLIDVFVRMSILVIHSDALPQKLHELIADSGIISAG